MNIPDQDHIDKVIMWISYAEEDIGLANYAMKKPGSVRTGLLHIMLSNALKNI